MMKQKKRAHPDKRAAESSSMDNAQVANRGTKRSFQNRYEEEHTATSEKPQKYKDTLYKSNKNCQGDSASEKTYPPKKKAKKSSETFKTKEADPLSQHTRAAQSGIITISNTLKKSLLRKYKAVDITPYFKKARPNTQFRVLENHESFITDLKQDILFGKIPTSDDLKNLISTLHKLKGNLSFNTICSKVEWDRLSEKVGDDLSCDQQVVLKQLMFVYFTKAVDVPKVLRGTNSKGHKYNLPNRDQLSVRLKTEIHVEKVLSERNQKVFEDFIDYFKREKKFEVLEFEIIEALLSLPHTQDSFWYHMIRTCLVKYLFNHDIIF